MLISRERLGAACAACLALLALGAGAPAQDTTLGQIVSHQLEHFNAITSIDYTFQESKTPGEIDRALANMSTPGVEKMRIRSQNGMWRGDLGLTDAGPAEAYAYNGDQYQMYRGLSSIRALDVQRGGAFGVPYGVVPPTLHPFFFAYNNTKLDGQDALKDEKTWSKAFQDGSARILSQSERVGDQECAVVELSWPPDRRGVVHFAKEKGYFPIVVEMFTGPKNQRRSLQTVEELTEFSTDRGIVYLPTKISLDSYREDNGHMLASLVWELDKSSIRINQEIPSTDFAISHALATHYTDRDNPGDSYFLPTENEYALSALESKLNDPEGVPAKDKLDLASASAKNVPSSAEPPTRSAASVNRNRVYMYVLTTLLIVACAVFLWYKSGKKANK